MWTGQNLPAAKEEKKEKVWDKGGQTASRILSPSPPEGSGAAL
jgi:hypothetical protein